MPFVQEELDRSTDAVREFVRSRFPGHGSGYLLDATELAALNDADQAEYLQLLGLPPTAAEADFWPSTDCSVRDSGNVSG
jgi:hypothetical protein